MANQIRDPKSRIEIRRLFELPDSRPMIRQRILEGSMDRIRAEAGLRARAETTWWDRLAFGLGATAFVLAVAVTLGGSGRESIDTMAGATRDVWAYELLVEDRRSEPLDMVDLALGSGRRR